jgi:membrane glycosyltransferase
MLKHTKLVKNLPFANKHAQRKRTTQFANVIINEVFQQKVFFWEKKKGNFWIIVNLTNIAIFEKTSPHIWYHKVEGKKKAWV